MKSKILFISIAAPPKTGPESLQVAKVLNLLREVHDITLITEKPSGHSWSTDSSSNLSTLESASISLHQIQAPKNSLFKKLKNKLGLAKPQFPDDRSYFWKGVDDLDTSNFGDISMIYSRSFPLSSSLAALNIKKKLRVPWIMHLSDPWTINPYHPNNTIEHKTYEKMCFAAASIISLTNEAVIQAYKELYPEYKNKFKLFTNISEPHDHSRLYKNKQESTKIRIVHSGNFYKQRNPSGIINAIQALDVRYKESIELVFVGHLDQNSLKKVESVKDFQIKLEGSMSYEETLQYNLTADILLSIDAQFDSINKNLFMPSKLLDYMYAKKPILAITDENSPTYNFVNNKYGNAFRHNDEGGIKQWIMAFIDNKGLTFRLEQPDERYSAKYNVDKLNEWISGLSNVE